MRSVGHMTRLCLVLWLMPACAAVAQTGTVEGVVFDSLSGRPLADATVQLVSASDSARPRTWAARTDTVGWFRIEALPPGPYAGGFFHPMLDSLGLEATTRALSVAAGTQRVDFAVPSPRTLVAAVCPAGHDSSGLVIGHVRSARDRRPLAGASVTLTWTELVQEALLVKAREQSSTAETTPDGWFAVCEVPLSTAVMARATWRGDSSGYVRFAPPGAGVRHAPFYLDERAPAAATDSVPVGAPSASQPLKRVAGTVQDERGQPLAGADVAVWGTERSTRSGPRGTFVLDSLPGGTQTLEVRAVGFTPVLRVVHLIDGERVDLTLRFAERVVALPTVNVSARTAELIRMTRFYERMRDSEKGINRGYFITPEDMERRRPPFLTQMFDGIPGIRIFKTADARRTYVQGPLRTGHNSWCQMSVFVDGIRVISSDKEPVDTVDQLVDPSTVSAVEVYPHPVSAPPQYQSLGGMCGVILIWTR